MMGKDKNFVRTILFLFLSIIFIVFVGYRFYKSGLSDRRVGKRTAEEGKEISQPAQSQPIVFERTEQLSFVDILVDLKTQECIFRSEDLKRERIYGSIFMGEDGRFKGVIYQSSSDGELEMQLWGDKKNLYIWGIKGEAEFAYRSNRSRLKAIANLSDVGFDFSRKLVFSCREDKSIEQSDFLEPPEVELPNLKEI